MSNMKLSFSLVFLFVIFGGKFEVSLISPFDDTLNFISLHKTVYLITSFILLFQIISGKFTAEGLKCFECKAEDKEKCYYSQSKDEDAPEDLSWFGEEVDCDETATHCMTARTRKNTKIWFKDIMAFLKSYIIKK